MYKKCFLCVMCIRIWCRMSIRKFFLVKLKECGEGGEDACAPFCLCGVVAEL